MGIVGKRINSKKYGYGIITNFEDDLITVSFSECEKTFAFPTAFETGFLSYLSNEDKNEIEQFINNLTRTKTIDSRDIEEKEFTAINPYCVNNEIYQDLGNNQDTSDVNNKIDKLKKLVINERSIAVKLINLFSDAEFEKTIFTRAFSVMKLSINGYHLYSEDERALIIVAMTYLALKYYENGNLRHFIYTKYLEYINISPNISISEKTVIEMGFWKAIKPNYYSKDYRSVTLYKDKTSYVAVPLVLSVVPHYKVDDLFHFAKDIYKKKLLFSEEISEEELRFKIYETLNDLKEKNYINDKYDDEKIGDYCLCAYTKCCIQTEKCIDDLITIISQCIRIIINYLTLPEDAYYIPDYFKEGFDLWASKFTEKELFEQNVLLSKPIFYFDGHHIHIKTGKINMDSRFDPNNVELKIYAGDEEIIDKRINGANDIEFDFKDDIVGGYIINRIDVLLNHSPLDNISYRIFADGEQIYSSKNYLYRTNIFIDERGNEVKPGYKYNGEIKVVTKNKQNEEFYELKELYNFGDYYIYKAFVDDKSTYSFDNNSYIFYKIENPEILGYSIPWAIIECDDKKYPIYKDQSFIFRSSAQLEDLNYMLDGATYTSSDNNYYQNISIYAKEHNEYNTYIIKINNISAGFHALKIFNSKTGEKIKNGSFYFVSDSQFKRNVERRNNGNLYSYESELLKKKTDLFYENGCSIKTLDIFVPELGYSKLHLFPSDFTYSIDGNEWHDRDDKIRLCSIPNTTNRISICGPNNAQAYYYDENKQKQYLSLIAFPDDDHKYWLYLSPFRSLSLSGLREKRLYFEAGKKARYVLVRFVPHIDKENSFFSFDEKNGMYSFKIAFDGCDSVWAKIYDTYSTEKVFSSKRIKSGDIINISKKEIDDYTSFLTVALFLINETSIIQKPLNDPFWAFEKYAITSKKVELISSENDQVVWLNENHTKLYIRFIFKEPERLKVLVLPTGIEFEDVIIKEKLIVSGEIFEVDISKMFYYSYFVRLLLPNNSINAKSLFTKRIDNDLNPYMKKTFVIDKIRNCVSASVLDQKNYKIYTKEIRKIETPLGLSCLIGADVYQNGKKIYFEYLLDVVETDNNYITFRICGEIADNGRGEAKSRSGSVLLIARR